jgi:hypothetical protein
MEAASPLDPRTMTLEASGSGGAIVVPAGEAKSLRRVARLAKRSGVAPRRGEKPVVSQVFLSVIGAAPLVSR